MKMHSNGRYDVQHIRDGKVIGTYVVNNAIVDVGATYFLETGFHDGTKIAAWYIGLIDNSPAPTENLADTMASHAGWVESIIYDEATRVQWLCDTAASRAITNTSVATFTINGTGTIYGLLLASGSAKSGTTGTLMSTGAFTAPRSVIAADTLKITYTVDD